MLSGSIFSIYSLSELGKVNEVSRNDLLFCHTPYNLAMVQQRRSKPMHMISLTINMHNSWMLLFYIISASNDLFWWLLTNIATYTCGTCIAFDSQASSPTVNVGILHSSHSYSWRFLFRLSQTSTM